MLYGVVLISPSRQTKGVSLTSKLKRRSSRQTKALSALQGKTPGRSTLILTAVNASLAAAIGLLFIKFRAKANPERQLLVTTVKSTDSIIGAIEDYRRLTPPVMPQLAELEDETTRLRRRVEQALADQASNGRHLTPAA